jgi:hypothetical protein
MGFAGAVRGSVSPRLQNDHKRFNENIAGPVGSGGRQPRRGGRSRSAAVGVIGRRRRQSLYQGVRLAVRRRQLASNRRAGRYSRGIAWQRLLASVRQDWKGLLILLVAPTVLMVPQTLGFSELARGVMLGAAGTAGVSIVMMYVLVVSGAAASAMGTAGEQWTAEDLRCQRRRGWRLINGLTFHDRADIDHVAIGPPGILVVESKWSAHPWPGQGEGGFMSDQLAAHVKQAKRNRAAVHGVFSRARQDAPVLAALVLQSPTRSTTSSTPWYDRDGVTVVRGDALRRWLDSLDSTNLQREDIDRVWTAMSQHVERRDRARPAGSILAQYTVVGLMLRYSAMPFAGVWLSLLALRVPFALGGWPLGLGGLLGLIVAGLWGFRSRRLRPLAAGWLFALALVGVLLLGDWMRALLL